MSGISSPDDDLYVEAFREPDGWFLLVDGEPVDPADLAAKLIDRPSWEDPAKLKTTNAASLRAWLDDVGAEAEVEDVVNGEAEVEDAGEAAEARTNGEDPAVQADGALFDDVTEEHEPDEEAAEGGTTFTPSREWQDLLKGAILPGGARLMAEPSVARVTVFKIDGERANKLVTRDKDGAVKKIGAVMGGYYSAATYPAPDAATLAGILHEVACDPRMVPSLGTFDGLDPGEVIRVVPEAKLRKLLGGADDVTGIHEVDGQRTAARLRANMLQGAWFLLDRDIVPGMPDQLAALTFDEWFAAISDLLPGIDRADRVVVPSTTGRVLVDGEPMRSVGWHMFVRVDDPEEMAGRVWPQMLVKSHGTKLRGSNVALGFQKPMFARDGSGRQVGSVSWSIYDPSTVGRERLVYDGQPLIRGRGLKLADPVIEVFPGEAWPTRNFVDVEPEVAARVEREHKIKLVRSSGNGRVREMALVSETLDLDLEVETRHGWRTIRDLAAAGERVRCQTPFRDSDTWNAVFNVHGNGSPLLFDQGTRIKYVLPGHAVWADPAPLPEGRPPVDPFDLDMLPQAWRPWVEDVTDRMQIAPDLVAMALVVEASALIGRQVGVRPKRHDDWLVIPNLYGLGVGRPSLLKTPAIREALKPIHAMAQVARVEHAEAMRRHAAAVKVHKASEKASAREFEKAAKGATGAAREQLIQQLLEGDDEPDAPVERRYMTNDTTVEKLGELLRDNPRGILIFRDELIGLLRGMERDGREQDRAFYLEAWDGGGQFTYDRIVRGTIHIPACAVAIVGAACPGPLQGWVSQRAATGSGDDGLLQRFQLAVWPDHPGDYVNVDRPPDVAARDRMHKSMWDLDATGERLATAEVAELGGNLDTKVLRFDDEAQEAFDAWRVGLERRLREPDLVPAWESHLGKYRSLVPSLALIFHLVDGHGGQVGLDAWFRAEAWAEYLESHARRIYDGFLRPHALPAHALAEKIRAGSLVSPFKLRDVYRPQWTGLTTRDEAGLAVETLVDAHWLSAEEVVNPLGGRPTTAYHINPKCMADR